jgi:Concanavalin A-like lectin/glucanases superfamily
MVDHARLRLFPVSVRIAALCTSLVAALCLVAAAALPNSASAASYSPVAEYSFDEGEGAGTAIEDQAGENDGIIEGAGRTTRGHFGGALEFHGVEGECASVPNAESLQLKEEFTIEAWVKSNQLVGEPIVYKETEGYWSYWFGIALGKEGRPEAWIADEEGEEWEVRAPSSIEADVWTNLAVSYDGARLRLYVDGEQVASKAAPGATLASESPLWIGCAPPNQETFDGRIDELRLYDRALSGAEVAADMETPIQTPRSGPVAEYSLDAGTGTLAEDLAGENDGTIEGAGWVPGRYGSALGFEGREAECVSVPDAPSLQLSEEFTIEAWVKPEGPLVADPIVFKEVEGEGGFSYALGIGLTNTGRPQGYIDPLGPGEQVAVTGPAVERGAWVHLAVSYDGGRLRVYIDGEMAASHTVGALSLGSDGPLRIGCAPAPSFEEAFEGRIDEVRLYERALGEGEVDADMETPIQTPRKGPVADYSFDEVNTEGETETVEDLSGDDHTATLHGATFTEHGRYGGALEFDAAKEAYVSIPADPGLDGSEELTVEAWVRPSDTPFFGGIAMKEREGSGAGYSWTLDQHSSEPVGYFMQTEEGMVAGGEHSLPLHTWTHVAMTDDGAHDRLYVGGQLVDTAPAIPFDGHGPIKIGGNQLFGQWFDGRIDELRIYERALGGAEVAADMEAPLQTPKATPAAEYSFDEDKGETVEDQAGEHDGTVDGAEWTEHGRYGGAMQFDGESMITVPASEDLDLTQEFTLEAWIRPEAGCTFGQIFVKEDAGEEHAAYVVSKHGSKLGAYLGVPGVEEESPSGALEIGVWQHIAVTFDGSRATLYVDGEDVGSAPVDEILSTSGDLRIGGSHIGGHGGDFVGRIDEVRIYARSLSESEIAGDMETPIQTPKWGPVAVWSFDEIGEGNTAEDLTGDGHTATIEGATLARGKFGGALSFDGSGQCATVPAAAALELREELTVEAWIKPEGSGEAESIVFKEAEGEWFGYSLFLGLQASGKVEGLIANDPESEYAPTVYSPVIEPNVWTHVAMTYDGRHERLYIDGVLVDTETSEGPNENNGDLRIGCTQEHETGFDGRIDEVRLYERALSQGEMADIVPPRFPQPFVPDVSNIPDFGGPTIFLPEAVDPFLPDGNSGSGVKSYTYRYKVETGEFTNWQTSDLPYFEVAGAEAGDSVTVQAYVTDNVDNRSGPAEVAVLIPLAEELELEESEPEPYDGKHPDEEQFSQSIEARSEAAELQNNLDAARLADGEYVFTECNGYFSAPHFSRHAAEEGAERINSVYRLRCDGDNPIIKGSVLVGIMYNGISVSPQLPGYVTFSGPPPVRMKMSASTKCDRAKTRGKYRTVATLRVTILVNGVPKLFKDTDYSDPPVINPCEYSGIFE